MEMTEARRQYWQKELNPFWIATQDGTLRFRKEQATPAFLEKLKGMGYTPSYKNNGEFEIVVNH